MALEADKHVALFRMLKATGASACGAWSWNSNRPGEGPKRDIRCKRVIAFQPRSLPFLSQEAA